MEPGSKANLHQWTLSSWLVYHTLLLFLLSFVGSSLALEGVSDVAFLLLPLINSFNKTEAAVSPMQALLP